MSFKTGFLLTDKKLYFTDGDLFSKNISVAIDEIKNIEYKKKIGVPNIIVNDSWISITALLGEDSVHLYEMLRKSVEILQTENVGM